MTIGPAPLCMFCKKFKAYWTCEAFEQIPMEIIQNQVDHRSPVEGDGGVLFEVEDDIDTKKAYEDWQELVRFD